MVPRLTAQHGLYLQAKLSTATDTKSRANSDGKDKVPKDKEGKKSAAYSQFGLRQSGSELRFLAIHGVWD